MGLPYRERSLSRTAGYHDSASLYSPIPAGTAYSHAQTLSQYYCSYLRFIFILSLYCACILLVLHLSCIVLVFLPPMGTIIDYWSSIPCLHHTYIVLVFYLYCTCIALVFYLYCTCLVLCLNSYPLWERLLIIGPQFRACIILILCLYSTCIIQPHQLF